MKIITILLLMIGWNEAALGCAYRLSEQCNIKRKISSSTIRYSINYGSRGAVINKLQGLYPKAWLAANKELIGGIYKTVDQFKTESGQIREQDKEKIKDELYDVWYAKWKRCYDFSFTFDLDNAGGCDDGC